MPRSHDPERSVTIRCPPRTLSPRQTRQNRTRAPPVSVPRWPLPSATRASERSPTKISRPVNACLPRSVESAASWKQFCPVSFFSERSAPSRWRSAGVRRRRCGPRLLPHWELRLCSQSSDLSLRVPRHRPSAGSSRSHSRLPSRCGRATRVATTCGVFTRVAGWGSRLWVLFSWGRGWWGLAFVLSVLVRWPIVGIIAGFLMNDVSGWRRNRVRFRAAVWLSVLWAAMFALRVIVQLPMYLADNVVGLGITRLIMGWPLYALMLVLSWVVIRAVYPPRPR